MLDFEQGAAFGITIKSQASQAATLRIRGMTKAGAFTLNHTTAATSIVTSQNFRLPDIPIWLTVETSNNGFFPGEIFAAINLTINGDPLQQLVSGLVYGDKALTWPSGPAADSRPNGGALVLRLAADPAAGAEISIDVPTGEVWRVQSVAFQLVTSATAANRKPHLQFLSNGRIAVAAYNDYLQTASTTINYAAYPMSGPQPTASDATDWPIGIPQNLLLHAGDTIRTVTTALQAGDNYGVMQVNVEMWFETSV
ncbi:MAG: hypothetical protein EPO20_30855 [Betaproteobacteria bacterium]|nr:MAG: hypothetical protein EPO20_30855 [Betaproteobacteria bacterium]